MFVFQAAHTWTKARFVPRCRSQPDLYVKLHLSSADKPRPGRVVSNSSAASLVAAHLMSSSCTGLRCRLSLSNQRLQMFSSFHQVCQFFLVVVSSLPSETFPVTVPRATRTSSCGDAVAPSSTTVSTAHSQYCLSWAHTHSYVFPRCRPKSGLPVVVVLSLCLYLFDLPCQLWFLSRVPTTAC